MRAWISVPALVLVACATFVDPHRKAIEAYFAGFTAGDFSRVSLAPDVVLIARGEVRGAERLRETLQTMAKTTRAVTIRQISISGDHGCAEVLWEMSDGKQANVADCFDFVDGQIAAIRVYAAPRAAASAEGPR